MEQIMEYNPNLNTNIDIICVKQVLFAFVITFKLWSFHSSFLDPIFSKTVSQCLDCLGYSEKSVKNRIKTYGECSDIYTEKITFYDFITAGSNAEGVALMLESDIDAMFVFSNIVCVEHNKYVEMDDSNNTIFLMDDTTSPSGYTKLRWLKTGSRGESIVKDLINELTNEKYLTNDKFKKHCSKYFVEKPNLGDLKESQAGPTALSLEMDGFEGFQHTNQDCVVCLRCNCKRILETWKNRSRNYDWPPSEIFDKVAANGIGYVVPVGIKGRENENLEWRICFTTIELDLMRHLNDIQRKVYILLKRYSKSKLKPICPNITSYVLKNLILWLAENNSPDEYKEALLSKLLLKSLVVLKRCVLMVYLPSYMIPDRNLLDGKITDEQRMNVTAMLNICIDQGDFLVYNLSWNKLFDKMLISRQDLDHLMEYRDNIEAVVLEIVRVYANGAPLIEGELKILKNGVILKMNDLVYTAIHDPLRDKLLKAVYPYNTPEFSLDIRESFLKRVEYILS